MSQVRSRKGVSASGGRRVSPSREPVRCDWAGNDPLYRRYHDREWGVPQFSDRRLFEFLVLEGAQAGLAWITILRKRPAYRTAFHGFDFTRVGAYTARDVRRLLADEGIVRNRLKVHSAISNANAFQAVRAEFGTFSRYLWAFVEGVPIQNRWRLQREVPASTELSDRISRDLRDRGFSFVGTTIIYAFMQATGMVNDHLAGCFRHREVAEPGRGIRDGRRRR